LDASQEKDDKYAGAKVNRVTVVLTVAGGPVLGRLSQNTQRKGQIEKAEFFGQKCVVLVV